MTRVRLRYWAGARAAAGVETEELEANSVAAALTQARSRRGDARFDRVLAASSLLIDGVACHVQDLDKPFEKGRLEKDEVEVEVLPPFAGGRV